MLLRPGRLGYKYGAWAVARALWLVLQPIKSFFVYRLSGDGVMSGLGDMSRIKFPFRLVDRFLFVQSLDPFAGWLGMIRQEIVELRHWSFIAFQSLTLTAPK